jgi:hypothetical protein
MAATIVRLLPADEHALLSCYVAGGAEPPGFDALYKALGVPAKATPPRLTIASPRSSCTTFRTRSRSGHCSRTLA